MLLLYEAALLRGCGAVEGNYMPLELIDEVNGCIVVGKEQRFQLIGASLSASSLSSLYEYAYVSRHSRHCTGPAHVHGTHSAISLQRALLKVAISPHGFVYLRGVDFLNGISDFP